MKQTDVMMPRIGAEAERPRSACPDCKAPPRQLGVEDFPPSSRAGVLQAFEDGADFFGCDACGKRWAVVKQRMKRDADGIVSLEPVPRGHVSAKPAAAPHGTRKQRRAIDAQNARAIRRNVRLAAREGSPVPPAPSGLQPTEEERRRVRNKRKADRQKGRS